VRLVTYVKHVYDLGDFPAIAEQIRNNDMSYTLPDGRECKLVHHDLIQVPFKSDRVSVTSYTAGTLTLEDEHGNITELYIERGRVRWTINERYESGVNDGGAVSSVPRGSFSGAARGVGDLVRSKRREPLGVSCTKAAHQLAGEVLAGKDVIVTKRGVKTRLGLAAMIDEVRGTPDEKVHFSAEITITEAP
jgi:hypothetical protein